MNTTEQMNRKELTEARTSNRKVFENQDHSRTVEIYLDPVHYQDTDGSWKEMDDTLEAMTEESPGGSAGNMDQEDPEGGNDEAIDGNGNKVTVGFTNKKGDLSIFLNMVSDPDKTAILTKGDKKLSWGLEGSNSVKADKSGNNKIVYPNVFENTDLQCRIHGEGVKEDLILHNVNALKTDYACVYKMTGVYPVQESGRVSFMDENEEPVFCVHAPCMKDADGKQSENIRLELEELGEDLCRITFSPDRQWLESEERSYPVRIDPVTTTSKKTKDIQDAHVSSLYEEDNFQQSIILKTMGGDEIQRSFMQFVLPELKTGDMVVNARLVLVSLATDKKERTVEVHEVLHPWKSGQINWYNKPMYSDTIEDLCTYEGDKQKYITMDITRMVKSWYQKGSNHGLMIKDAHELSGYTEFLSSDCDSGYQDMRPRIDISYVNYSGLEDYWTYHSQEVGRAGTVHVNDYNGNLIMIHNTMDTDGSLVPMSLSHVYNSNNCGVNLGYGYGFALNYHQTVKKVTIAGTEYYKHTDGDGTVHYFYLDSKDKKWKEESGLDLTITLHPDRNDQIIIHDKEDGELRFHDGYLVRVRDKNKNVLTIRWADDRIIKIIDGAGRTTELAYMLDSNGKRTYLQQIQSPSGKKKLFSYKSGNLTTITDIDGEKMSYVYDENHMLTEVKDIDGYSMKYLYYSTNPHRVRKITEYGGTVEGNSLSLSYGYNSTKFTDNKKRSEICRFNNNGNLIHIQDGFGHAASGKYGTEKTKMNCLTSATKLQTNVVQLLKDPIIQAQTLGWKEVKGGGFTGTLSINTKLKYCKVGDRSLRADASDTAGSGGWSQNVTLEKGKTYTFSMYVKAYVKKREEAGGVLLRVRYQDKDGNWCNADSECLTETTADMVLLHSTFKVPADASSATVQAQMLMIRTQGGICGDMAQLEAGTTVSRCNLVDNGDFQLGSTAGFTKTGVPEDGLTTAGTENMMPVQYALLVKANQSNLYKQPDKSSTVVAEAPKGTHLSASFCFTKNGHLWYKVTNAAGKQGYIPFIHTVPYLGGGDGSDLGAVGVSGAVLRATPSDTGAIEEEVIPVGTSLSLQLTRTDDKGNLWYYLGMQIDKKKYEGYMREDQVIRLFRNYPKAVMTRDDGLYEKPSLSSTKITDRTAGASTYLRGVLVKGGKKWYAVLWNGIFRFLPERYAELKTEPLYGGLDKTTAPAVGGGLDSHIYKFTGDPTREKKLTKTLDLAGKKDDVYMVNAWGMGTSLPIASKDAERRFGVQVNFVAADGTCDVHYTNFSPDIQDWQFLSDNYVAKHDYVSVEISYVYSHNANIAFFDGISLYREEFGQTYTYNKDNEVTSVVDVQKNTTTFKYGEETKDLTGITTPKGKNFKYEYDDNHNVIKGTSASGRISRLIYDEKGNIQKSGSVRKDTPEKGLWVTRTFTEDGNHVASVTDTEGNTTGYEWDTKADLLRSLTDGRGNKLTYGYDKGEKLVSVAQKATVNGILQEIKNTYSYTKDDLTDIGHNGFHYNFAYDIFGNMTEATIARTKVVSYVYESDNGNLLKTVYGNGDSIRYVYDKEDRVKESYYQPGNGAAEQKLNSYVYGKDGNLNKVTNHMSGKTYELSYDFLDRLMRVRDEKGAFYEYTYDADNQMVSMVSCSGKNKVITEYTYDSDGREYEVKMGDATRLTDYDELGRVTGQYLSRGNLSLATSYEYPIATGNCEHALPCEVRAGSRIYRYTYDKNGNVTAVATMEDQTGTVAVSTEDTFSYDERNQLIREDLESRNKTVVYDYDQGGNLISVKEYAYTIKDQVPQEPPVKTETGTYGTAWKDQLMSWNGTAMSYDAIGNMLTKGDISYSWTLGRKLSAVNNGKNIRYEYDHTGARIRKTVDNNVTEYRLAGDLLVAEVTNGKETSFVYDSGADLVAMIYEGKYYFYVKNLQGDIVSIVDESGTAIVNYSYDSWGRLLQIEGSKKDTIGILNPFRYRGYYYDTETGMYYLKNRYYDPEIRRFISADTMEGITASMETLHNRNLYSYCNGNPLTRKDYNGTMWGVAVAAFAVGAVASICTQVIDGNGISWTAVATSGVTMAMGLMGAGIASQIVVSAAGEFISCYFEKKQSLAESVVNAAVEGGLTWGFDKMGMVGDSYLDATRRYYKNCKMIKNANLGTVQEVKYLTKETGAYRKSIYGIFKATAEVYPIRNAAGSAAKSGVGKVISYISMTRKRRCMGYKQSYNPRTRTNSHTPVWTYY